MGISVCTQSHDHICTGAAPLSDEPVSPALPEDQTSSHLASLSDLALALPPLACASTRAA